MIPEIELIDILATVQGHIMNAKIDLQTGTKAMALRALNEAYLIVSEALARAEGEAA